jgi:succinoglycan biosynthesis protein ExoA
VSSLGIRSLSLSEKKEDIDWPAQTVVIPVRNEERFIESTIVSLQNQDYPKDKLEIIIVDGQSDDATADIVKRIAAVDSRIKLMFNPGRLSSAGRNIGARAAKGEIVTYVDGHTYIEGNQLLKNIARSMNEKGVSVLSRPQFMETPDNGFFQQAVALARRSPFGHGLDSTIYLEEEKYVEATSSGASYKKEVFEKVGYFDEDFDAAEDLDFNYRVHRQGYTSFSSPRLSVFYYPRESLGGLFQQMKRYGIGRFRFLLKHRKGFGSGTLFPPLLVAGPPIALLLSIAWPFMLWPLAVGAALYLALDVGSAAIISVRHNWRYIRIVPLIYLVVHIGLGWGFLSEMVRVATGRRTRIRYKTP